MLRRRLTGSGLPLRSLRGVLWWSAGALARGYAGTTRSFGVSDGGIDWVSRGPHARHLSPAVVERVEALRGRVSRGELAVPGAPQ